MCCDLEHVYIIIILAMVLYSTCVWIYMYYYYTYMYIRNIMCECVFMVNYINGIELQFSNFVAAIVSWETKVAENGRQP